MPPPWAETQSRVVIEYIREGGFGTRTIKYRHTPEVLPSQLHGRVAHNVWMELMRDVMEVGKGHPYVHKVGGGRCLEWMGAAVVGLAVGFCCMNPDGGEYGHWLPQVYAMLDRHRPFFAQAGCSLSLQHAQGSYWVQVDVDPKSMAMGQPVMPPAPYMAAAPSGYPGQYPPQPTGQHPPQYPPQPTAQYPPQYPPQPTGQYPPQPTGQYPPQPTGQYPPQPTGQYPPQPAGQYQPPYPPQ